MEFQIADSVMASYRSSDAACAPPESQKAAADDVYVVALDYECPDRDLCRPDQYLDFQHKFDWKKRTLLQIYKHNEPWQWTPNDLERINLMVSSPTKNMHVPHTPLIQLLFLILLLQTQGTGLSERAIFVSLARRSNGKILLGRSG